VECAADHDGSPPTTLAEGVPHRIEQYEDGGVYLVPDGAGASQDAISLRAYELWRQRGCPEGSADQDWFEAAKELRENTNLQNAHLPAESGSIRY
jgi:hypothetical protein